MTMKIVPDFLDTDHVWQFSCIWHLTVKQHYVSDSGRDILHKACFEEDSTLFCPVKTQVLAIYTSDVHLYRISNNATCRNHPMLTCGKLDIFDQIQRQCFQNNSCLITFPSKNEMAAACTFVNTAIIEVFYICVQGRF